MKIRKASLKEVREIQKLNTAIFEETNTLCDADYTPAFAESDVGRQYFMDAISSNESIFLVAEDKGRLIGYINGSKKIIPYRVRNFFEIDNLGVLPEYRNQGIGGELLRTITNKAKIAGFNKIYVNSYVKNTTAINFYKNQGFQEIDVSLEKGI
jgi:ribosomal protein S18 acetylase RimI-like enzyme